MVSIEIRVRNFLSVILEGTFFYSAIFQVTFNVFKNWKKVEYSGRLSR